MQWYLGWNNLCARFDKAPVPFFFFLFLSLAPRVLTSTTCHDPLKIYLRLCFHIIMPSRHKKCFSYLVDFISQCGCTTDKQPVFTPFTDKQVLQKKTKDFENNLEGKTIGPIARCDLKYYLILHILCSFTVILTPLFSPSIILSVLWEQRVKGFREFSFKSSK